jgi:hypothetical protein
MEDLWRDRQRRRCTPEPRRRHDRARQRQRAAPQRREDAGLSGRHGARNDRRRRLRTTCNPRCAISARATRQYDAGYAFNSYGSPDETFGAVCGGRVEVFLEVIMPSDRLLIVGGGHCGRALAQAASLLNFSIVVADDRDEHTRAEGAVFRASNRCCACRRTSAAPAQADEQTYVVLVSKGFITDTAALKRVIGSRPLHQHDRQHPEARRGLRETARKASWRRWQCMRQWDLRSARTRRRRSRSNILAEIIQARASAGTQTVTEPLPSIAAIVLAAGLSGAWEVQPPADRWQAHACPRCRTIRRAAGIQQLSS